MSIPIIGINFPDLWDGTRLRIPMLLKDCYRSKLIELNLLERASADEARGGQGPEGGLTDAESLEHFARRYGVGACRIQAVTLGITPSLIPASADILSAASEGAIRILDIPCGSGATTASLLGVFGELRRVNHIPRFPLSLDIIGADHSPKARELYLSTIQSLSQGLSGQGIFANIRATDWDATASDSTAQLMDTITDESTFRPDEYCVLISNFSGSLSDDDFFSRFSVCLAQILGRLSTKRVTLVWVEPESRQSRGRVAAIKDFFNAHVRHIAENLGIHNEVATYEVEHPIRLDIHSSGMKLMRHFRR
ncbi:MAG: hypothetical protein HYV14_15025 [Elusimicrobia bacterium]|nr:hypothetical protein [Elusimicrobiota bacterium]